MIRRILVITAVAAALAAARAQVPALPAATAARMGRIANHTLEQMQAPSASVAIVEHDQIVFTHAYGLA